MRSMSQWGPRHDLPAPRKRMRGSWRWPVWVLIGLALLGVANGATKGESTAHIVGASLLLAVLALATFPPRLWELITAIPRPKRKAVQQRWWGIRCRRSGTVVGGPVAVCISD